LDDRQSAPPAGEPFRVKPTVVATTPAGASVSQTIAVMQAQQAQRANDMRAALDAAARRDTSVTSAQTIRAGRPLSRSTGIRASADVPGMNERSGTNPVSVAQLLDSVNLALPDTTTFREYDYKVGYRPESIYRPSIGYAQDNYGRGLYGGAGVVLADLLGNNQMILAGQVNGRLSEAFFLGAYTSLGNRLHYTLGVAQSPYFFIQDYGLTPYGDGSANYLETYEVARYIVREAFAIGMRPTNRFNRMELGVSANNVSRSIALYSRAIDGYTGYGTQWFVDSIVNFRD
jgi:hypothetical protein